MEAGVAGTGNWLSILIQLSKNLDFEMTQQIRFVARRLVSDRESADGDRYTFATPLYVSADDVY